MFDLDETLTHCVTKDIEKAERTITVLLNTGESVKVNVLYIRLAGRH